jgi:hypothetical protein
MQVRTRPHRLKSRSRIARQVKVAARAPQAQPQQESRERDAGGPEDRACYRCSCGCVFEASVSTTVGCPHCGSAQAW